MFEIFLILFAIALIVKIYFSATKGKCECVSDLHGKTILITGANRGIGYETAKNLAQRGARVIITSENYHAIKGARERMVLETGNQHIIAKYLDLRSLKQVREFAEDILRTEDRLDVLINNAGTAGLDKQKTEDGIYPVMQINHVAPFLLTHLVLGLLKKSQPSRIVNVGSFLAQTAWLDENNINYSPKYFHKEVDYSNSKLCVLLTTNELATRLKGTQVTANTVNPGYTMTDMISESRIKKLVLFTNAIAAFFIKTPREGAQTSIHVATCDSVQNITGKYFSDCKVTRVWARQGPERTKKVWDQTIKLAKIKQH